MAEQLVDSFGRVHRDLRISVTDRCNFRCTYCMPAEGMDWLPRAEVLTFEEIERIARVCVERFGIDSIRLTGGEPTVRAHLPVLVAKVAALRIGGDGAPVDLALTTNGATLRTVAGDLAAAGLRRVNISLDTLRPDRFVELTRRDELDHVLDGIDAAVEAGLRPGQGQRGRDAGRQRRRGRRPRRLRPRARRDRALHRVDAARRRRALAAERPWSARPRSWRPSTPSFPVEPSPAATEPAERFAYRDGRGEVGVIPSVTSRSARRATASG